MELIAGIHAVEEALLARGRSFEFVAVDRARRDARMQKIMAHCRENGIPLRIEARAQLDRLARGMNHQGVIAVVSQKKYSDVDDILAKRRGRYAFVLVLDGVEDPHNLGAVLRTADAAAVDGVVLPERRATGVSATVVKVSAGASEHLPIARVTNLARTIEELKSKNIWTVGLDERGEKQYHELDFKMDCALILGAEGHGLHEQVRKKCDFLVSIPMLGKVSSLNVSVAAGIVMYEVVRQRQEKK